jgi:transcription elongation regulator 1
VKNHFVNDPRYSLIKSSSYREELFTKFLESGHKPSEPSPAPPASDTSTPEPAQKHLDKAARQAASLREREEKARRDRERIERMAGRSRMEAGREEAEREFRTLLIDAVRDHEVCIILLFVTTPRPVTDDKNARKARWSDVEPNLSRDPRFTHAALTSSSRRGLFDEHLAGLRKKRMDALEALFAAHAPALDTPFSTVHSAIANESAVSRARLNVEQLEEAYHSWQRRRRTLAESDFMDLMRESGFVDFWGRMRKEQEAKKEDRDVLDDEVANGEEEGATDVDLKQMAKTVDLKEIHAVLKVGSVPCS